MTLNQNLNQLNDETKKDYEKRKKYADDLDDVIRSNLKDQFDMYVSEDKRSKLAKNVFGRKPYDASKIYPEHVVELTVELQKRFKDVAAEEKKKRGKEMEGVHIPILPHIRSDFSSASAPPPEEKKEGEGMEKALNNK